MNVVIKIGGSLIFEENRKLKLEKIIKFSQIITEKNKFDNIIIVCGGGKIAREYINAVRTFTKNETLCDVFGIEVSRLNSRLIISALKKKAYPLVPKTIEELSLALLHDKIIVMGGLQPEQSTTSVACEVAEYIKAEILIILTDVKGIYDKDPNKYSDAELMTQLTYSELQQLILDSKGENQAAAGEYRIFDTVSLQILKRSKIRTIITSGLDLAAFKEFWLAEKKLIGTEIME